MDRHELLSAISDAYACLADLHAFAEELGDETVIDIICDIYSRMRTLDDRLVPARPNGEFHPVGEVINLADYRQ